MTTALDLDIAALVGEQEDQPCEHSAHGSSENHADEPASHYIRGGLACGCPVTDIYPACPRFVAYIQTTDTGRCSVCRIPVTVTEQFQIIAPIKGTAS